MRILQLTPRPPWPPLDGGRVAMLQITRSLRRIGAGIEVLSLNPAKHHIEVEKVRRHLEGVPFDAIDIDTSRVLGPAAQAPLLGAPWLVSRFHSGRFASALKARLRQSPFDVVHVESPFLLSYLPLIREESKALVTLRAQNLEFTIWEALADHEPNAVRRAFMRRVAGELKRWERDRINACDALVAISDEDARGFLELGVTRPSHVMPCGIETAAPVPPGDPWAFCFVGSMSYRPNQEALHWIATELWPRVARDEPRIRITVAGSACPEPLRDLAERAGLQVAGQFDDLRSFLSPFGAMIAPLFSGSGMRIKVLEAMALGKPVVATGVGAAGIAARSGRDIEIADDTGAFSARMIELARDPERSRSIGEAGRSLIEREYHPDVLARGLVEFYEGLLRRTS